MPARENKQPVLPPPAPQTPEPETNRVPISLPRTPVTLTHYLRATDPDSGHDVTYTPGEQLPPWAADLLDSRRLLGQAEPVGNVLDLTRGTGTGTGS